MRKVVFSVHAAIILTGLTLVLVPSNALASGPVLTWSGRTSMPTARYSTTSATTLDGDIIVFGGHTGAAITGNVERFHPATNSWTSLAPMPTPRNGAAAATATDGIILVVGGFPVGGDSTNLVEAYDPASNMWSTRASLPANSSGPGGVRGPDGTIYMIGGYPGCCFNYLNTVYAYDQATDSWTSRAPMPTPREAPAIALAADGKIYVVGGNGNGPTEQVVEVYDPVANTWQSRAPAPVSIRGVPLVSAPNGKLYVFGFDMTGAVLEYDTAADTWTPVEPMPTPRLGPAGALAGDGSIYAIGGFVYPAAQTTAVTERATLAGTPVAPMYNVAVNTKANSANQSISATAAVGVPAGDTITVSVATGTFTGAVGCTDAKGNAYTVVADKNTGNGRLFVCSSTLASGLAAGDVVTATYPRFSGLGVVSVNAIPVAASTGTVDRTSTNSGNNPNPSAGNVTTQHPAELIFGVIAHNSVPTFTPGPGLTIVGAVTGGTGSGTRTVTPEYMLVTTAGTYTATGTLSSAQQWRAAVITYM